MTRIRRPRFCTVDGCDRQVGQAGLCTSHFRRLKEYGNPLAGPPIRKTLYVPKGLTVRERFLMLAKPAPSGCWEWHGHRDEKGYGRIVVNGKVRHAHRVSIELHGRTIPRGLEVDHLCRNRCCVNPRHLDLVTRAENNRRKIRQSICPQGHSKTPDNVYVEGGRTHCKTCAKEAARRASAKRPRAVPKPLAAHCGKGHEYTPENTIVRSGGQRTCRICNRERQRRYKQRVREQRAA